MKITNFLIFFTCLVIIGSFFAPWIGGSGSLAKPLDDGTLDIQRGEPTGLLRFLIKGAKGTLDTATVFITALDLERELRGYELPAAGETRKLRPKVYLVCLSPLVAFAVLLASLKKRQPVVIRFLNFVLAAAAAFFLTVQAGVFSREGIFVRVEALYGFFLTYYGYLALSLLTFLNIFSNSSNKPPRTRRV